MIVVVTVIITVFCATIIFKKWRDDDETNKR